MTLSNFPGSSEHSQAIPRPVESPPMEEKLPADTQTHLPLGKKIGAELSCPYTAWKEGWAGEEILGRGL